MSSLNVPNVEVHMLALLKQKWGILVNNCEATTNWANQAGTTTIATASKIVGPLPADREANYKEDGSYTLKVTGSASSGGDFLVKYTPAAAVNFSGTAAEEFATGWLTYFSLWIKTPKAGTFRVKLVDGAGKTAYWDIVVTVTQKYYHNVLGTYTAVDSGFTLTTVTSIHLGYVNRSNGETTMEFRADGLRVQGDPTFDSFDTWSVGGLEEKVKENALVVHLAKSSVSRRTGMYSATSDSSHKFDIGPQPVTLRRRPLQIGYQFFSDPMSNRSEGYTRRIRDYTYNELYRILSKNGTALQSKGIDFVEYIDHTVDDDYYRKTLALRGFIEVRLYVWGNVHGAI